MEPRSEKIAKEPAPRVDEAQPDAEPIGVVQIVNVQTPSREPYRGPERRAQGYLIAEVVEGPSTADLSKPDSHT